MFEIVTTNNFEKDFVRSLKRSLNIDLLQKAVKYLELTGTVPANYKPHILSGKMK